MQAQHLRASEATELVGVNTSEVVWACRHPWHVRSGALTEEGRVPLHALPQKLWRVGRSWFSLDCPCRCCRCLRRCLCSGLRRGFGRGLLWGCLGSHLERDKESQWHNETNHLGA